MKRFRVVLIIAVVLSIFFIMNSFSFASDFSELRIAEPHKTWTIKFNDFVQFDKDIHELILVKGSQNQNVDVKLELGQDGKSILVSAPHGGYILDKMYTLYIDKNVKSLKGSSLKESINMNFKIEKEQSGKQIYDFSGEENLEVNGYLNILGGKVEIENDQVTLSLHLRDIPDSILFNKVTTGNNIQEYSWGVDIGIDSCAGYSLSASRFKFPNSSPQKLPIEKAVQTDVWTLSKHPTASEGSGSRLGCAQISIDYDSNIMKLVGTISDLSKKTIDYIRVTAKEYEYTSDLQGTEIIIKS